MSSEKAASYGGEPWQIKVATQVSDELRRKVTFIGAHWSTGEQDPRKVRLLDYACGTGSVSRVYMTWTHVACIVVRLTMLQALAPYVNDIRGIDISENMVDRYNDLAKDPELMQRNAKAVVGNLFTEDRPSDSLNTDDLSGFDIAAVGLGFHHFTSPTLAISRLAERVLPGGVVLIIDLLDEGQGEDEANLSDARPTMTAHGFSEASMKKTFEDAGLQDAVFGVMEEPIELVFHDKKVNRKIFLARAIKPTPDETL